MRKRIGVFACIFAVALTGCASVPELSQEDNEIAAQYMAGELLKHDKSYGYAIDYDRTVLIPTPEPTQAPTVKPSEPAATDGSNGNKGSNDKNDSASSVKEVSIEKLFGLSGVSIKQTGYSLRSKYSDINSVEVSAGKGNRLLVVTFAIKNTTGSEIKVNLKKPKITYGLNVDGKEYGGPLLSILNNDMQYFSEKLSAGKSRKCVLIYELPSAVKIKNASVSISKGNNVATVALR